jgi:hypothetical protein
MTTGLDAGPSLLVRSLEEDAGTERPGCAVRITRCWVPLGTRPDDQPRRSRLLPTVSIRSRSDARRSGWGATLRLTKANGNHFGNPGADSRHHRTGLDGIGSAPEQPGWFWAGPVGRFRSDSYSEGRRFESDLGLPIIPAQRHYPGLAEREPFLLVIPWSFFRPGRAPEGQQA